SSVVFLEKYYNYLYSPSYTYEYIDTLVTYDLATQSTTRQEVMRYDNTNSNNYYYYGSGQVVYIPGGGDQSTAQDNITNDTTPTIAVTADTGSRVQIDWGDGRGYQDHGTATGG